MAKKSIEERLRDADERASMYLADANAAQEWGEEDKANRLFEKSQFWLDRYNKLAGNM
jgi:uncharacterized protein HemY